MCLRGRCIRFERIFENILKKFSERLPTERLLIATVAMDAEKVARVSALTGQPINILAELTQKFKSLVGF